nr:hypothetical protein CFP56_75365 [Quercus suber]
MPIVKVNQSRGVFSCLQGYAVLGESFYLFGKYLDYEEKYVVAQSKVDALSAENLKTKVTSLSGEVLNFFHKYMAKHHPGFDFSTLDMEAVEKEILANRLSIDGVAGDVEDRMEDDTVVTAETLVDSSPSNPTRNTSFISSF